MNRYLTQLSKIPKLSETELSPSQERLVLSHLYHFAKHSIKQFPGHKAEDNVQEIAVALIKAAKSWDSEKSPFSQHAKWHIKSHFQNLHKRKGAWDENEGGRISLEDLYISLEPKQEMEIDRLIFLEQILGLLRPDERDLVVKLLKGSERKDFGVSSEAVRQKLNKILEKIKHVSSL